MMTKLKGNQAKIDKNKNGMIDGKDLEILRAERKKQKPKKPTLLG